MSGSSIPYHLRPHKAVDRRLFLDLLSRFERWRPLSNYVYLSMGAYPLEDHKLVHRLIGITKLVAFDMDEGVVARQTFNRPIDSCYCIRKKSGELIAGLEMLLKNFGFADADGVIIWLDYTEPRTIGQQIREFQSLLDRLRPGDIVRITVNAHPQTLGSATDAEGKQIGLKEKHEIRLRKLKERIGDFLPSSVSPDRMTPDALPAVLSEAFAAAALKALPVTDENIFCPLSIVRYADGQQMLSITGAVVKRHDKNAMVAKLDLLSWPFASTDWTTVHRLVVPDLTVRERLFLERGIISSSPDDLINELGFKMASDVEMDDFLKNYKNYYRFYPTLLQADI